jgi:L,D-transpeptidase ErfK/SrfK
MKNSFALVLFILIPSLSKADIIIGGEVIYKVVKGDTIGLISAKLGVSQKNIIQANNIDIKKPLSIGQELRVNNRRIVPKMVEDGIIINIPDRMLYFFKDSRLVRAFPVGLGMPSWRGITRWRTPLGEFDVIGKQKNPTWYVPESMQWKMEMEGKPVRTIVPPGPDNPLGRYSIKTSISGIVIHETIWPTSVYQFRGHGCIRVMPEVMEKFFDEVEINTPGELIYEPVKVAVSEGRMFLEVHKDIYGKVKDLKAVVKRLIEEAGGSNKVDWQKVDRVIDEKSGIAEEVTL